MKYFDHNATNEVICPYCGYEFSDSWEFKEEWGELKCDECNKTFKYERFTEATYFTEKKED